MPKNPSPIEDSINSVPSVLSDSVSSRNGGTQTNKKVIVIHHRDAVHRIAFTMQARSEAIEKSIRMKCGIETDEDFALLDNDGDSIVIDGSMEPGDVWLDLSISEIKKEREKKKKAAGTIRVSKKPPDFAPFKAEPATKHAFDARTGQWNKQRVQVRIDPEPFAEGNLRRAHYMCEAHAPHKVLVAKISIDDQEEQETYFQDVEMQMYAKEWARKFNSHNPPKKVDFLIAWVITLDNRPKKPLMAVEEFIDGPYRKHNNNYGYVNDTERNTPQAFSHFTYEASNKRALICDIQGVDDLYTDPQMHTIESMPSLGKGNLGSKGFDRFFATHHCNAICQYLRLSPVNSKSIDPGTKPENTFMPAQEIERVNFRIIANANNGLEPSSSETSQLIPSIEPQTTTCCVIL
eukprot:TRINITY_DN136_c1_g2_i1.p1 TRINITY_DN136_c1_g2~~TRINITY_DN136_c1_g2_i1.p1  ORF type:complete len:405 (-),score=168.21 TRINITY_DN136_c1_g2_i1:154-1368(-)